MVWDFSVVQYAGDLARAGLRPKPGYSGIEQRSASYLGGGRGDSAPKQQVQQMARDIGFDAVDAGPRQNARLLEPLGYFNVQLGYVLGLGTDIGLKLVRR